jgi:uncharacterized membrane protein YedE/YeeE
VHHPLDIAPVSLAATFALLFLIGYSSQRSGVCMMRAVSEVIDRRRVHRLAGFGLAAASAMLVMAAAETLGAQPFTLIPGAAADSNAIAGGVLFGIGTLLSGHCAMGTLAALTAGDLPRIAAIAAMFAAALLLGPEMSQAALMLPPRGLVLSPLAGNLAAALAIGGALAVLAGTYIYRRLGWRQPRGGWSPLIAMSLVGAASGLLFALDRQWVYTSRIAGLAYGTIPAEPAAFAGPAILILGMTVAALVGGTFEWKLGTAREWLRGAGGGLLMGLGATLVPGGNDAMLFTGVPLLLPNLLTGYAAFTTTLFIALIWRQRRAA